MCGEWFYPFLQNIIGICRGVVITYTQPPTPTPCVRPCIAPVSYNDEEQENTNDVVDARFCHQEKDANLLLPPKAKCVYSQVPHASIPPCIGLYRLWEFAPEKLPGRGSIL